jgi:hypothetical protein
MKRFIFILMVFTMGIFISGIVPSANATLTLTLTSGVTSVTVVDGDADGVVTYNGALGSTVWSVNVTTGISYPTIGGPTSSEMDLNSVNVSSSGGGTLILELVNSFDLPILAPNFTLLGEIGGTTQGTLDFTKTFEARNAILGTIYLGPFGPGAFSGSKTILVPATSPFMMRDVVTITHTKGGQVTSFDARNEASPVPEPGTLLLLGAGLVGIAGYTKVKLRRRKK